MSAATFFTLITVIGGIGWLSLILLSPFWKGVDGFVIGIVFAMMAIVYSYLNFGNIGDVGGPSAFMSFDGVMRIFSNPYLVDGGWAHILSLDILLGIWIKNNAAKSNIPYWLVVLVLLLTIMFAPFGILVYLIIHWIKTKQYFVDIQ